MIKSSVAQREKAESVFHRFSFFLARNYFQSVRSFVFLIQISDPVSFIATKPAQLGCVHILIEEPVAVIHAKAKLPEIVNQHQFEFDIALPDSLHLPLVNSVDRCP
ncbi:hypothetical protein EDM56_00720 [Brevibacillus fluminis]|uniref:Uncharacterized protein n=1 Tax=Brevibacillus fluminis TaxID=511487 RepID=A0A3M8DVR1_9BACL|nr:hypothetical protein [Brevibacillus fluminis]RNB92258.1 hypothetical protein EDM56_00720 [Brevibacillus fluminis]